MTAPTPKRAHDRSPQNNQPENNLFTDISNITSAPVLVCGLLWVLFSCSSHIRHLMDSASQHFPPRLSIIHRSPGYSSSWIVVQSRQYNLESLQNSNSLLPIFFELDFGDDLRDLSEQHMKSKTTFGCQADPIINCWCRIIAIHSKFHEGADTVGAENVARYIETKPMWRQRFARQAKDKW